METTKRVIREYEGVGTRTTAFGNSGESLGYTDTTEEHLCSVELGATAKGDPQIKSVKVYAATPQEAAEEALATFRWLCVQLGVYPEEEGE